MTGDRRTAELPFCQMRQIRADGDVVDALQVELITRECEVVVAEKAGEGLEVVAVGFDGVDRDVSLVRQVIEEIADLVFHCPPALPVAGLPGFPVTRRLGTQRLGNHVSLTPPWRANPSRKPL